MNFFFYNIIYNHNNIHNSILYRIQNSLIFKNVFSSIHIIYTGRHSQLIYVVPLLFQNEEFYGVIDELVAWLDETERTIKVTEPVDLAEDTNIIVEKFNKFKVKIVFFFIFFILFESKFPRKTI